MKRKVIELGGSTLVVSLPRSWSKKYGLKKGDELEVGEHGKDLIISTCRSFEEMDSQIDLVELGSLKNYGLSALYFKGVDEIDIRSSKSDLIEVLQHKPINQFIGYEIIEQTRHRCLVRDVSTVKDQRIEVFLRRVFLLIQNMYDEIGQSLKNNKTNLAYICSIDLNVNRFSFLCLRLLKKEGYKEFRYTPEMYLLVVILETIGDDLKEACQAITDSKTTFSDEQIKLFEITAAFFKEYQSIFFRFDIKKARELDNHYRKTTKLFDKVIELSDKKQMRALFHLQSSFNSTIEMLRNQLSIEL